MISQKAEIRRSNIAQTYLPIPKESIGTSWQDIQITIFPTCPALPQAGIETQPGVFSLDFHRVILFSAGSFQVPFMD